LNVFLAHGGGGGAGIAQDVGVTWALLPLASVVWFTARVNKKIRREIEERGKFENAVRALEQEYREEKAREEGIKA
jgi:hypothetical protein